ncbi:hypothetical protein [Rodentibacter heidelbergensis]|uniref:Uncharacterized protein n=1 Tax=Rodentibacter heidelbergensis TaxID=1908258 RepID=A0A1V3ICU8_9PAST|nr:hypothetical protein [Rodentibacter heidelbergensis]OOF37660.1 hypothetical protein BKK48_01660 [Rodentibacter heidelbergensis]
MSVVNNAVAKSYINGQLTYESAIGKGVNGVRSYVNNSIKSMSEQPVGTVLKGVATSASVKAGFEAYDYATGKPLTVENLKNSGVNIAYSGGLAAATAGMPIIPATGLGVMGDWAKDGKYDVVKTTGGTLIGNVFDSKFSDKPYAPFIRESLINGLEKVYESTQQGGYDEKR